METTQFAKQTIGFQKTIFENSFKTMIMIQDQTENMVSSLLDTAPWATDESKKSMQAPLDMAKKARNDFKKAVDDGFAKFEELLENK